MQEELNETKFRAILLVAAWRKVMRFVGLHVKSWKYVPVTWFQLSAERLILLAATRWGFTVFMPLTQGETTLCVWCESNIIKSREKKKKHARRTPQTPDLSLYFHGVVENSYCFSVTTTNLNVVIGILCDRQTQTSVKLQSGSKMINSFTNKNLQSVANICFQPPE